MRKYKLIMILVAVFLALNIVACAQQDYRDRYKDGYNSNQPDQRQDQQQHPDYLVEFFEHSDYRGNSQTYELTSDKRHVLIDFVGWDMNDRISSIRIGRGVGVALFQDRSFNGPVAIYDFDTPLLDQDINDWASSAIIFDLNTGGPLGVWLGERDDPKNLFSPNFRGRVRFFPLRESIDSGETRYDRIDEFNDNVEWVVLGPATRDMFRSDTRTGYRSRYDSRRRGSEIEMSIYEHGDFRGRSLVLPSRYGRGQTFVLKDFDFNRIASSLIIREIRSRY